MFTKNNSPLARIEKVIAQNRASFVWRVKERWNSNDSIYFATAMTLDHLRNCVSHNDENCTSFCHVHLVKVDADEVFRIDINRAGATFRDVLEELRSREVLPFVKHLIRMRSDRKEEEVTAHELVEVWSPPKGWNFAGLLLPTVRSNP
jgi:hypothetical protein